MKRLFHIVANEGKAITELRNEYAKSRVYLSATKAELMIKLKRIKALFDSP